MIFQELVKSATIAALVLQSVSQAVAQQPVPDKRAHHELVYDDGTGTVLMTAGSTPLNGGESFRFFNDVWRYGATGWIKSGVAGDERSGIKLVFHTRNRALYSYGGFLAGNQCSGQLRVLQDGEWKVISDLAEMKAAEPGFVYDIARNRLVAFGGSGGQGQVNSATWEWDGLSWKKFEGTQPGGRQAFAMVYDSKRNKTVLYGGGGSQGNAFEDGVWEFDGKRWENISGSTAPGLRLSPGAAFDSKRGQVILFGGVSTGGMKGDTWGWDGKSWKRLADTGPPARAMGYMAYDKLRDKVVLFGGRLGWPNDGNDTWEWDGEKWAAK